MNSIKSGVCACSQKSNLIKDPTTTTPPQFYAINNNMTLFLVGCVDIYYQIWLIIKSHTLRHLGISEKVVVTFI